MKKTLITLCIVLACTFAKSQSVDSLNDIRAGLFFEPADSVIKTDTSFVLVYGHVLLPVGKDEYDLYSRFKQVYERYTQHDRIRFAEQRRINGW